MSLHETTSGERVHIGFFGRRNAGKSSLVNAVTGQSLSVVSDVKGTTTDPVKKAMELLPIGPVMIIDTPGFDDEGDLGQLRVEKTREILAKTDVAVLVTDAAAGMGETEQALLSVIREKNLPYIIVHNKADLLDEVPAASEGEIWVSAKEKLHIHELKEKIGALAKKRENTRRIVADLLSPGDVVILVTPIDDSAPKGRIILPQQQTLRDILDAGCTAMVCQDTELPGTLSALAGPPRMVITDSQAFGRVNKMVPENIPLTSFSILFARYKGNLEQQVKGAARLSGLSDGDRIVIAEGCTHHRQCGDIGTVKMPAWIENFSGAKPEYTFTSGGEFPADLSEYRLVVHCGGCMLTEAEMTNRVKTAVGADVPVVNYGVAIAHMHGILRRSLELFPDVLSLLDES
ncbi:MAG: [FeFe] hydrogenase H-cluster maturation GTPase HydF [Ruminococcaceae bacterium]|nr:[FeFe] hydrogenase H-cluster maturation GTPase HydF [Oscillospiraceae bacterium]